MPIYEYQCQECGEHLEKMQRITADPLKTCPACGEDTLKKLISQTSFVLKGGGWYVTDYGGKGKKADKAEASSESSSTGSDSSSSSSSSADSGTGSSSASSSTSSSD